MSEATDICMLVEGTYPYVSGGVSSWIHSLITNLPDFSFSIVHIGSQPVATRSLQYQMPANVVAVHDVFLQDVRSLDQRSRSCPHPTAWKEMSAFHDVLRGGGHCPLPGMYEPFIRLVSERFTTPDLLLSAESWDLLVERYTAHARDVPFLDFFWTFRASHLPLFQLLGSVLPPARIYHAPSAGFSGLLGAVTKMRTGAPLLITEHGIYMHEREIEIAQAEWIPSERQVTYRLDQPPGYFREWWTGIFRFMTHVAYDMADEIISVTSGNQRYQLLEGADPQKMRVILNGVDLSRFSSIRASLARQSPGFSVGFVGRVVPIKDVKTFIRAVNIARNAVPDLTAFIVGPTEEDPGYFAECQQLIATLGLEDLIHFTGRADVREYYRMLDVLVLTSISEAAPLVILEANCAGVPVIATNVGACKEMLEGESPEDQALGLSGLLTTVSSPQETADAIIRLARDESLRQQMAHVGQERTRRFYDVQQLYGTYRRLYQRYMEQETTPFAAD